jgi:hypothetical protein
LLGEQGLKGNVETSRESSHGYALSPM